MGGRSDHPPSLQVSSDIPNKRQMSRSRSSQNKVSKIGIETISSPNTTTSTRSLSKRYAEIQGTSGNKHEGIQTARCKMRRLSTPLRHGSLKVEFLYANRELERGYGKFDVVARMPGSVLCIMRPCVAYHEIWLETGHVRPIGERGHAALGRRRCRYLESRVYTAWRRGERRRGREPRSGLNCR